MSSKESDLVRLLHGKSKSILLCGKNLKSLPESIGILQTLNLLDARNNQLSTLPDSIQLLKDLKCLQLSSNKFESLPNVLTHLIRLEKLLLFSNPLTDISGVCSSSLSELRLINLNNCKLSELPTCISALQSLEVLSLSFNKLTSLPVELCELGHLRQLILNNNKLKSLPFEIGRLWSLEKFTLPHNKVKELPESLAKMKRLRCLDIACNQIRVFPTEFSGMCLEELFCESNPLLKKNCVKSVQEREVLTLRELCARLVMREAKKRSSYVRKALRLHPNAKQLLSASMKCEICSESFLNTWLECVRFVDAKEINIGKCSVSTLPQRVLLCSYDCFNLSAHDFYGVAFP